MAITVELESLTTKSRFVTPTYVDRNGTPSVISSELPMPIVDINHLRLHEGRAYYAYKLYPDASKLAAGASVNIAMAFATGVKAHLAYDASCGGDAEMYLYENAVVSGGTTFTAVRRNRTIATASQSAILVNPTVTSVGTLLEERFIAGGVGRKAGGGNTSVAEQVFSPLTTYLFRLTNANGTAHMAHLHIEWYE